MFRTTWHDAKASVSVSCGGPENRKCQGQNCDMHPGVTKASALVNYTLVKRHDEHGSVYTDVAGPSIGASASARYRCSKDQGVGASLELSLAKAKVKSGSTFVEGNLNVNTGLELGTHGGKVNVAGFGSHFGAGRRFSLDTPFGSIGFNS